MKIKHLTDLDYYEWGVVCATLCVLVGIVLLGLATQYEIETLAGCAVLASLGALVALRAPPAGLTFALVAALAASSAISASRVVRPAAEPPPPTQSSQDGAAR